MFFAFFVTPTVTVLPDRVVGIILCKFFVGFRVPATAIGTLVFFTRIVAEIVTSTPWKTK